MMDESSVSKISLEDYLSIAKRRRWFLLIPFFAGWACVWVVSWILPASYRSETVILVERQKVPEQYVVPNVAVDLQERLQSMTQQILSRTRLEKIIENFNLYPQERSRMGLDQVVEKMRSEIKIDLVEAPNHQGELTAFKISYTAPSAKLAQDITGELTSLFIDENLQAQAQQSESTTQFLGNQLDEAKKNLEEQEKKLKEYKTEFLGQLPEQLQSNVQILSGLQGQLESAESALHQAQQQKTYLDSLASHYKSISTSTDSGSTKADIPKQIEELKAELADLSTRYTPNHPDVKRLKEKISALEKLNAANSSAAATTTKHDGEPQPKNLADLQAMSPMMQVEGQIKANDLEIKNREREVQELQGRVESYQARLNLTPLREQQLSDLTRDHEQALNNYQSLLAKEMQSRLATNLERRQQGEQFSIIDPPSLPRRPFWPNRLTLSLVGLGVGLALSLVVTGTFEIIQNRLRGEKDAAEILAMPILAGIPLIVPPAKMAANHRRFWIEAAAVSAMIGMVCIGNLVSFLKG